MIIKACAKINFFLHILNKEPNGYHKLNSLVGFTRDLFDDIHISESDHDSVEMLYSNEFQKIDEKSNIVNKALLMLPKKKQYNIKIIKKIPIAAGLGGGSADAANILKFIINNENLDIAKNSLEAICLNLGADVKMFLDSSSKYITGFGEKISDSVTIPEIYAVIANPNIMISTKDVFNSFLFSMNSKTVSNCDDFQDFSSFINYLKNTSNDLTDASVKLCPLIHELISDIENSPNCYLARMSGSGASCFGLYPTERAAREASKSLGNKWWSVVTKVM